MQYTSLKLSVKLADAGCTLPSEMWWGEKDEDGKLVFELQPYHDEESEQLVYPAYDLLWDITVKYAKEFFGEKKFRGRGESLTSNYKLLEYYTEIILRLLQQGKQKEAEEYILEHCLFNPKNN